MAEFNQPASSDAAGILRQSRERYAGLKSYRDSGEATYWLPSLSNAVPHEAAAVIRPVSSEKPQVVRFRGWFRNPADLRFEWITHQPFPPLRHLEDFSVIWNGEAGAYFHASHDSQPAESLRMAVARATGVSSGTAFHFATLFVPDIGTGSPLKFLPIPGVDEETVEEIPCWKVKTRRPPLSEKTKAMQIRVFLEKGMSAAWIAKITSDTQSIVTVLVAKHDLLVRRFQECDKIETRRDIHVDEILPDDLFRDSPGARMPHGS